MNDDLQSCPLCNKNPILTECEEDDNDRAPRPHRVYVIHCSCGLEMKETSPDWWSGSSAPPETPADLETKLDLITAWNNRATAVNDKTLRERIQAALDRVTYMPGDYSIVPVKYARFVDEITAALKE